MGQTANFRFGSEPDIPRHSQLSPLSGAKRTLKEVSRILRSECALLLVKML